MPAPSAMTKPSRRASNGRLQPLLVMAVMFVKAATPVEDRGASDDPATTTSHRPDATSRAPLITEWVPAAQAVTTVSHGPRKPNRIEMPAAPALFIMLGTRNGDTRFRPFS